RPHDVAGPVAVKVVLIALPGGKPSRTLWAIAVGRTRNRAARDEHSRVAGARSARALMRGIAAKHGDLHAHLGASQPGTAVSVGAVGAACALRRAIATRKARAVAVA